jgi:acyl transferase domain-containing protein/thioesterase domain-containing protein
MLAIVGAAGEFPGAASIDELWQRLRQGDECITHFTRDELVTAGVDPARLGGSSYVRARGVLANGEVFDNSLFGIPPSEAILMDPQQRRLLQIAWAALEDAGYCSQLPHRVAVFAGAGANLYLGRLATPFEPDSEETWRVSLWNDPDYVASRASYKLNLTGPAVSVQTACSTSLVAVILAAQSLLAGDCDLALAGGVALKVPQCRGYVYTKGGILSPDGHCRPFDRDAAGTVPGNGAALVVLKRFDDAVADRDSIQADIRGYAINNDGSGKVSFSAPGPEGQAAVISDAIRTAEIEPRDIGYVEAHGTATALGDAIEIAALTSVFRSVEGPCRIGSVKGNVGHLDIASGIAGLLKATLMVRDGLLVPTVHFREPNPELRLEDGPFLVADRLEPWEGKGSRIAGVSSFGIGGTNAHVLIEEPPAPPRPEPPPRMHEVIMLSAETPRAMARQKRRLSDHLAGSANLRLADVSFTLAQGRRPLGLRRALVAADDADAAELLAADQPEAHCEADREPPVVFMFPGGGTIRAGVGARLYDAEPAFRAALDEVLAAFEDEVGDPVRAYLLASDAEDDSPFSTTLAGAFAFEHGLAALLRDWGIAPAAVIGHSLGEYAAAVLAGVFGLEDAARLVAARSRLLGSAPGAMLSVALPSPAVEADLPAELSIAARNAADLTVVSGEEEEIAAYSRNLAASGIEARLLRIRAAAHSKQLEPLLPEFRARFEGVSLSPPRLPFLSNVSGRWAQAGTALDADYWVRQLRGTVEFFAGIRTLLESEPRAVLVEVGPGRDLSVLSARTAGTRSRIVTMCPPDEDPEQAVLRGVARLWELGAPPRWDRIQRGERGRVRLPTYAFEERRFWPSAESDATESRRPDQWFYAPSWLPSARPQEASTTPSRVLIVGDDPALLEPLSSLLTRKGHAVRVVDPGALPDSNRQARDIERWRPKAVVFTAAGAATDDPLDSEAGRGAVLLDLMRALDRARPETTRLLVVTEGVHKVSGNEKVIPARRLLLGLCPVLGQELDWCEWSALDLAIGEDGHDGAASIVAAELFAPPTDRIVAYRSGRRLVQSFTELALPEPGARSRLREGAVYLVTGGLGRVGRLLCDHLVHDVKASVVVLTRNPSPGAPPAWLDSSRVAVVGGDATSEGALEAAVRCADDRFGGLDGVFHLAAITDARSVPRNALLTERIDLDEQLQPKAAGAASLSHVLAGRPLDFCVLFSSNASILGGVGLAAYAAANGVLDALGSSQARETGTPWLTLSWDGWPSEQAPPDSITRTSIDRYALKPAEAIGALNRALATDGLDWIAVSKGDLHTRRDRWVTRRGRGDVPDAALTAAQPDRVEGAERQTARVGGGKADAMIEELTSLWSETLGMATEPDSNFFELGGHSILALRLLRRIEEVAGVSLPANVIAHAPTPAMLAPLIATPGSIELVELTQNDGPVFSLVHPQGGGVLCYMPLAQGLGRARVLALDDRRIGNEDIPVASVEELADRYLQALRNRVPAGPYRIGGWSLGGVIAYEMSRHLHAEGQEVQLVLIDSPAPVGPPPEPVAEEQLLATMIWNWLRQAGAHPAASYTEFLSLAHRERIDAARAAAAAGQMDALARTLDDLASGRERDADLLHRTVRLAAVHGAELRAYRPSACSVPALLVRASAGDEGPLNSLAGAADLGWTDLIPSITCEVVEGDHASIIAPPQVRSVVAAIQRWWDCDRMQASMGSGSSTCRAPVESAVPRVANRVSGH